MRKTSSRHDHKAKEAFSHMALSVVCRSCWRSLAGILGDLRWWTAAKTLLHRLSVLGQSGMLSQIWRMLALPFPECTKASRISDAQYRRYAGNMPQRTACVRPHFRQRARSMRKKRMILLPSEKSLHWRG